MNAIVLISIIVAALCMCMSSVFGLYYYSQRQQNSNVNGNNGNSGNSGNSGESTSSGDGQTGGSNGSGGRSNGSGSNSSGNTENTGSTGSNTGNTGSTGNEPKPSNATNYNGLCSFAEECPSGWADKGTIGYIVHRDHKDKLGFPVGGALNSDWYWQHPRLCCNESKSKTKPETVLSTDTCGSTSGMIVSNADIGRTGLVKGGGYVSGWTWQHYYTCKDANNDKQYMLGKSCPDGWTDKGTVGIITHNNDLGKSPFSTGGALNPEWTWRHPRLCKKK